MPDKLFNNRKLFMKVIKKCNYRGSLIPESRDVGL